MATKKKSAVQPESPFITAQTLPPGFDRWNRAMQGAFRKGMVAHQGGTARDANPYDDKRKSDGRLTWSRAFECAWRDGWDWSKQETIRNQGIQS